LGAPTILVNVAAPNYTNSGLQQIERQSLWMELYDRTNGALCLHRWVVFVRTKACLCTDGLYLRIRVLAKVTHPRGRILVSARTSACVHVDATCLCRRVVPSARTMRFTCVETFYGCYSTSKSRTPEGPSSSSSSVRMTTLCRNPEFSKTAEWS
jgi:hypothetical protein